MKKPSHKFLKWLILLIVLIIVGTIIFYLFNPKKALTLVFPDLNKISNIKTIIKNDSAFTKISMVLQNKNPYKLNIGKLNFEVKLNDTSITNQTAQLNINQSSFDIDTINLPLNLNIKQIRGLIKHLQNQDSTNVEITGYIVYKTIFGKTKIDFHKNIKIEVPIPPQIKVIKIERQGFNLKEKTLKINAIIKIINKGKNIDIKLTHIHYDMLIKSKFHSKGVIEKPIIIKPQSSVTIEIPIKIEIYHPLKTAWAIGVEKEKLDYILHITYNVKENISKNSFASPAEITATGTLPKL